VEFEDLTRHPSDTLKRIYEFLGQPHFLHDFDNVVQYTREDDENVHRIPGLHGIRPKVAPVPRSAQETLGEVAKQYRNLETWRK
jgi:sulfotransferase